MKGINQLFEAKDTRREDVLRYARNNDIDVSDPKTYEEAQQALDAITGYFYGQMTGKTMEGDNFVDHFGKISLSEAVKTDDLSIVVPRVFNTMLQMPVEPVYFLMNNLAESVQVAFNDPLSIEFPSVAGAIAAEVGEDGEFPVINLSFARNQIFMKLRKYGILANMSEEIIKASQYPLLSLYLKMMKQAVDRKGESLLFETMQATANVVFDNESSTAEYHTSGLDEAQAKNYSFIYQDLIKMCSVLVGNRYNATHVLAHPMAYSVFTMDPFLKATFVHLGQIGGQIWNAKPSESAPNALVPFGLAYVPYYALAYDENSTLAAGPGSGLASAVLTDVYVIDQANCLYFANRGPATVESIDDWFKDGKVLKVKRYMATSSKDGGRGMMRAKKVRVVEAQNPLYTIRTVS